VAGNDIFLDLKGVPGESKDSQPDFNGKIELVSFGFSSLVPRDFATHQPIGKRQTTALTCVKHTDKSSAPLLKGLWTNQKFDTAKLSVRKAGGTQDPYFVVELEDVYVTSFGISGESGDKSVIPMETVQLSFGKITVTYKEQTALGTLGGPLVAIDDLRKQS
jgi:type VI secretion system secreted protein Hcp